jgi:MFS family permease
MKKQSIIILSLCALFLFYKYIAQLFPSLIGNNLMQTYGYNGVMLAIMASSYYYSYTVMQIIAGLIIDRYAIRIPMFIAILTISFMILIFTHTHNFYLMCVSRALIGAGAAFATVLYMKCAVLYASPKTFGLISSFLATATMLGAACGSAPLALLFNKIGWNEGLNLIAMIGLAMAFAVLIFQKNSTTIRNKETVRNGFANIKEVMTKKDNLFLLLYSGLTFSPVAILGGVWGTPFLMAKYPILETKASIFLSIMFIGHAIGSPLWALLSIKLKNKKDLMHFANAISFLVIVAIIYGNLSYYSSIVLFFIFGFSVGCFMLSFELCREINSLYVMGFAVAFINSGEGLIGSIEEPFIGYLLDTTKVGSTFVLHNYQYALSILPCCYILSSMALVSFNRSKAAAQFKQFARA